MKKILMITTGGTIASVEKDDGLQPLLSPEELLKYVPKVRSVCEVEALQAMNIDSTNMSPDNWLTIVAAIKTITIATTASSFATERTRWPTLQAF